MVRRPPRSTQGRSSAASDVYKRQEYSQNLLPVESVADELKVSGYIGNLNLVRARRGEQFLYINRRFVNDRLMNHAIISGYGGLLARSEFPFYCLNLEPVSYTHLRAHETVLDLVFRLLLDKKK